MYSATATEASLAETTAIPLRSSSRGISLPAWRNIFDPPVRPAFRLIFTGSRGMDLAFTDRLVGEVEGEDLGDGGRLDGGVRVMRIEDPAGRHVHQDGRIGR